MSLGRFPHWIRITNYAIAVPPPCIHVPVLIPDGELIDTASFAILTIISCPEIIGTDMNNCECILGILLSVPTDTHVFAAIALVDCSDPNIPTP